MRQQFSPKQQLAIGLIPVLAGVNILLSEFGPDKRTAATTIAQVVAVLGMVACVTVLSRSFSKEKK